MSEKTLGRRSFLRLSALTAVSADNRRLRRHADGHPGPAHRNQAAGADCCPADRRSRCTNRHQAARSCCHHSARPCSDHSPGACRNRCAAAAGDGLQRSAHAGGSGEGRQAATVDKRLPASPRVITPVEKVGQVWR